MTSRMMFVLLTLSLALATGCSRDEEQQPSDAAPVGVADAANTAIDAGTCVGAAGCYACAPTTSAQILNHCGTAFGSCVSFDNHTRLPLLPANGQLPQLP